MCLKLKEIQAVSIDGEIGKGTVVKTGEKRLSFSTPPHSLLLPLDEQVEKEKHPGPHH